MSTRAVIPMEPVAAKARALTRAPNVLLRRKCACGASAAAEGGCEDCKKKQLQRRATGNATGTAPPIVHEVLRSPGQPLDHHTRAFFEPRFAHDFSRVRVHADDLAEESARTVNATAYTVGQHVVFGHVHYSPETWIGRRLLAHELAHVVQQGSNAPASHWKGHLAGEELAGHHESKLSVGLPGDAYEREAESVADAVMGASDAYLTGRKADHPLVQRTLAPLLQRKLVINPTDGVPLPPTYAGPPTPLTHVVRGLLGDTCPDGHFQVDMTSGNVTSPNAKFCQQPPPGPPFLAAGVSSTPVGCQCICDVINNPQTTTIAFRPGPPSTSPAPLPQPQTAGTGGVPTNPTVSADPRFQGQYLINGQWTDVPFHLIFAHELCGHALSLMQGTQVPPAAGPPGGTPPHERHAVDVERQSAAEHNPLLPRRPDDYAGGARPRP